MLRAVVVGHSFQEVGWRTHHRTHRPRRLELASSSGRRLNGQHRQGPGLIRDAQVNCAANFQGLPWVGTARPRPRPNDRSPLCADEPRGTRASGSASGHAASTASRFHLALRRQRTLARLATAVADDGMVVPAGAGCGLFRVSSAAVPNAFAEGHAVRSLSAGRLRSRARSSWRGRDAMRVPRTAVSRNAGFGERRPAGTEGFCLVPWIRLLRRATPGC